MAVILTLGLGAGFGAGAAAAASLNVRVSPAVLHPGARYSVKISGSYDRHALTRAPYLLAFIQYGGSHCQATATAEYALPTSRWSWDFYPQRAETMSPFNSVTYWKAGSKLGTRWVCAYLYAEPVMPSTKARPLVRAGASFRDSRR